MTVADHTCRHGVDYYEQRCTSCEREREAFADAEKAVDAVGHNINGGQTWILGSAFASEHRYLLNEIAVSLAFGVIVGTSDSRMCPHETTSTFGGASPHPEHDGRISCATVLGAMETMRIGGTDEQILKEVARQQDRAYDKYAR